MTVRECARRPSAGQATARATTFESLERRYEKRMRRPVLAMTNGVLSLPELHLNAALDAAYHTGDGGTVCGEFPGKVPRLCVREFPVHPTVFHGEAPERLVDR